MVDVEGVAGAVALLLAEAEEAFHRRVAVRSVLPLTRGAPLELRGLRSRSQRLPGAEQSFDVDAIVDRGLCSGHWPTPLLSVPRGGLGGSVTALSPTRPTPCYTCFIGPPESAECRLALEPTPGPAA